MTSNADSHSRWVTALQTQAAKTADAPPTDAFSCPYCRHAGRMFLTLDQLYSHVTIDHASFVEASDPELARAQVRDAALRM